MNQGPRGDCLVKKTEGLKSRDTVPLKSIFESIYLRKLVWLMTDVELQCKSIFEAIF
jgi:hypothetical protein